MALDQTKVKIQSGDIDNFFDCIADVLMKHSGGTLHNFTSFKKFWSSYMLCRYLSMKTDLIPYSEYLNTFQNILTYEQMYILAYNIIPKQKSGFIKYYANKNKKSKNEQESINNLNINVCSIEQNSLIYNI